MFLIKMTFWLGLLVLLLPTDSQQQARLYNTAVATVDRAVTFCDRNAGTCTMAADMWAKFLKKAEFGARLVADLITSQGRQDGAEQPQGPSKTGSSTSSNVQGTLLPADMETAWRGPSLRHPGPESPRS